MASNLPCCHYVLATRDNRDLLVMAHVAILSLRHTHPDATTRLVVDEPTAELIAREYPAIEEAVGHMLVVDTDIEDAVKSSRFLKTSLRNRVEGDLLFLDIDTIVIRSLRALHEHASTLAGVEDRDAADLVAGSRRELYERVGWPGPRRPYLNSGVLFCRGDEQGQRLGEAWHTRWLEGLAVMGTSDQPALQQAMQDTGVSVEVLPEQYNFKFQGAGQRLGEPVIFHEWMRSALYNRHVLINHLMRHLETHGDLDTAAIDRARIRNDPWVAPGPGVKGNLQTGRYFAALKGAARKLFRGGE